MREYRYAVDREGRVFHDGSEIVDPQVLKFFLRAMTRDPDGRFLVLCQGERNWFEAAAGTPFVVQRLAWRRRDGAADGIDLCFAGDYREPLDPAGLEVDGGALRGRVRGGAFRACFGRVAMQQLAPGLRDDAGRPALVLDGAAHPIRLAADARS